MTDDRDLTLVERIADAFEHDLDPIPTRLTDAAREAFSWSSADIRIAELLYDSAEAGLVGVRGSTTERRSFRFGVDDSVIRVHLTTATLIVMIEPPMSVVCRISTEDGATDHRTDELGELVVDAPELPLRVEIDLPSGTVATPWITG